MKNPLFIMDEDDFATVIYLKDLSLALSEENTRNLLFI
jgi:hypothetical protein